MSIPFFKKTPMLETRASYFRRVSPYIWYLAKVLCFFFISNLEFFHIGTYLLYFYPTPITLILIKKKKKYGVRLNLTFTFSIACQQLNLVAKYNHVKIKVKSSPSFQIGCTWWDGRCCGVPVFRRCLLHYGGSPSGSWRHAVKAVVRALTKSLLSTYRRIFPKFKISHSMNTIVVLLWNNIVPNSALCYYKSLALVSWSMCPTVQTSESLFYRI